jgi:hypothetical protein
VAILATVAALLAPALSQARLKAKLTTVHSDLRQCEIALTMYGDDRGNEAIRFPPCRFGCAMGDHHCQMPKELVEGGYLPGMREDPFNPGHTYKYEHPGPGFFGGVPSVRGTWVPDAFPDDSPQGREYFSERDSPVKCAVWSVGPDSQISIPYLNFDILNYPVPRRLWYPNEPVVTYYDSAWNPVTEKRRGIVCHLFDGDTWHRSGMWERQ